MENKKREYLAPKVEVKRVELESSICDGSADIKAAPAAETQAQQVNTDFSGNNNFSSDGTWDNITSTN